MTDAALVQIDDTNRVRTLTLNRPDALNAFSEALYDALDRLRDAGNSVYVVEHDLELMRRAQWLVDVGPGAGEKGGRVLYSGAPDGLRAVTDSQTARYLFDEMPAPPSRQRAAQGCWS